MAEGLATYAEGRREKRADGGDDDDNDRLLGRVADTLVSFAVLLGSEESAEAVGRVAGRVLGILEGVNGGRRDKNEENRGEWESLTTPESGIRGSAIVSDRFSRGDYGADDDGDDGEEENELTDDEETIGKRKGSAALDKFHRALHVQLATSRMKRSLRCGGAGGVGGHQPLPPGRASVAAPSTGGNRSAPPAALLFDNSGSKFRPRGKGTGIGYQIMLFVVVMVTAAAWLAWVVIGTYGFYVLFRREILGHSDGWSSIHAPSPSIGSCVPPS